MLKVQYKLKFKGMCMYSVMGQRIIIMLKVRATQR